MAPNVNYSSDQLKLEAKFFGLTALLKMTNEMEKATQVTRQREGKRISTIISFNVGGTFFSTNRQTLMKYPDSMLARMCSTDVPVATDSNGAYFIDRDPELFRLILNFLRNGYLSTAQKNCTLDDLEIEADCFGLGELLRVIRQSRLSSPVTIRDRVNESKEVIIFRTVGGSIASVAYPTAAIKIDDKSTERYLFKIPERQTGFREYSPLLINSMGKSLPTFWTDLQEDHWQKFTAYDRRPKF